MNIGRRGARATLGIPGSGLSWTFKCGAFTTPKANQAATAIESMRQMQKVGKRIAKDAVLSTYWKKAIIEQAQLLDKIMETAKASEDKRLIKVAQDLLNAYSNAAPEMRAAAIDLQRVRLPIR
jgi:predicted enzyme involved in methoxymalonyl-ACP biosynthesis